MHRNPSEHAKRRRMMAQIYTKGKLGDSAGLLIAHTEAWVSSGRWSANVVDLSHACRALEADIMCQSA